MELIPMSEVIHVRLETLTGRRAGTPIAPNGKAFYIETFAR
jgi:hypothetical protein